MLPNTAIYSICSDQQVAGRAQRLDIVNFSPKQNVYANLFSSLVQNLEQCQASYAGKAVSVN